MTTNQTKPQQIPATPLQKRTILANNALDAQRAFYAESMGDAYQQNAQDAQTLQQMGGALKHETEQKAELQAKYNALECEHEAIRAGAERFHYKIRAICDVMNAGPMRTEFENVLKEFSDEETGAVDTVEPSVGTPCKG